MSEDSIERHLYVIMWPNHALVASNLPPDEFGSHYTIGSSRYFHGQVIFAEIDVDYRHEYFQIEKYLPDVKPGLDGFPKRTKFLSTYRVLEHVALDAFKTLYVTTSEGKVLPIEKQPYAKPHDKGFIRTFQEVCPINNIVLSYFTPQEFGAYMTDPGQPKSVPKLFFTQIDLTIDQFLRDIEADPFHTSPIPNVHPQKLKDQIVELRGNPNKQLKGISLDSAMGRISFLKLRTGFWISEGEDIICFPIPDYATLQDEHYEWVRSLEATS